MEATAAYNLLPPSFSGKNIKHFPKLSGGLKFGKQWKMKKNGKSGLATTTAGGCVALGSSGSSVPEMEKRKPEGEMMMMKKEEEEEEEWWLKMGELMRGNNDKCSKEGEVGRVELLECLEREAIMGDDEGKEPTDYNRRALIFDESSRVFQALKDRQSSTT